MIDADLNVLLMLSLLFTQHAQDSEPSVEWPLESLCFIKRKLSKVQVPCASVSLAGQKG